MPAKSMHPDDRKRSKSISCSPNSWREVEAGAVALSQELGIRVSVSDYMVSAAKARAKTEAEARTAAKAG